MKKLENVLSIFSALSLLIVFVVVFGQVIQRYVFQMPMPWATDTIRNFFVYSVFLGMAVGVLKKSHLNIDVLLHALPDWMKPKFELVANVLTMTFLGFVFAYSFPFITANRDQFTPYLMFPMSYVYAVIPLVSAVMLLSLAIDTIAVLFSGRQKAGESR